MIVAITSVVLSAFLLVLEVIFPSGEVAARWLHLMALIGQTAMAMCWLGTEYQLMREKERLR